MKSINIASTIYAIKYVENPTDDNRQPADGTTDIVQKKIEIEKGHSDQQKKEYWYTK